MIDLMGEATAQRHVALLGRWPRALRWRITEVFEHLNCGRPEALSRLPAPDAFG